MRRSTYVQSPGAIWIILKSAWISCAPRTWFCLFLKRHTCQTETYVNRYHLNIVFYQFYGVNMFQLLISFHFLFLYSFKQLQDHELARHRSTRQVVFMPGWSAFAESAEAAVGVEALNLVWPGTEPKASQGLEKIGFKRICALEQKTTEMILIN